MMIELSREVPGIWIALKGGHYEEIDMSITIGSSYSNYAINTNETSSTERATQLLKKMDTDGDGKVSQSEFDAFSKLMSAQGPMGPPPPPQSSNGSSLDPVAGANTTNSTAGARDTSDKPSVEGLFQKADTNGDGTLSLDELSSMLVQADSRIGMQGSSPLAVSSNDSGSVSSSASSASSSASSAFSSSNSPIASANTNGDGSLSLDEFTSFLDQLETKIRTGGGSQG